MADVSPGVAVQHADVNLLNAKTLADTFIQKMFAQSQLPNAWELLSQNMVSNAITLSNRVNNNNAFADFALKVGLTTAQNTATTENQQTVSPAGTAASETAKGAVADSGAAIATAAAGIATANQAVADALAVFVAGVNAAAANLAAAMASVLTTAAGGASTPSQTKPPTS